jgi:putative spermidine/putrescine transport system ATP-binding protein
MASPILELKDLSVRYGEVTAISTVSLSIDRGEFVCILGPSGCGKSTLLNVIGGFIPPTAGEIFIDGADVTKRTPNARPTAMIFQSYALFPHMSVFDNVAYGLKLRKMPRAMIAQKVNEVLDLVKLAGYGERFPSELSGGQQQRVALARGLVVQPTLLLLDEPFSNIDAKLRDWMRTELKSLQRRLGIAMIFVTHDQDEAFELGDRVIVMSEGRVEQTGTAEELYLKPESLFTAGFIGSSNVLEGTVGDTSNGDTDLTLANGLKLKVSLADAVSKGETITAVIRPEEVEIIPGAPESAPYKGTIAEMTHFGSHIRYQVDVDGTQLRVSYQNGRQPPVSLGDRVGIAFAPGLHSVRHVR